MAFTDIEKVRIEIQDNDPSLPFMQDDEIAYFLEKHSNSVSRASLDAAKSVLMKLSQRGNETVDIFSFSGAKAAEQYRLALQLYLKDPYLNPVLRSVQGWVGGVSLSEMQTNNQNTDNNVLFRKDYRIEENPPNLYDVDC
jgi:hypothetical protein